MKLFIFAGVGAVVLAFIGIKVAASASAKKAEERITVLAAADPTSGSLEDVRTALKFLAEKKSSIPVRRDAVSILESVEADGSDEIILTALKESDYSPLQLQLSKILSQRGYSEAVPTIITSFNNAATDDQRMEFLRSLRPLAEVEHLDPLVESLVGSHSPSVRRAFEDVVLTVLRKSDVPPSFIDDLLTRTSTTSGAPRKSLFQILGTLGGEKVLTRLTSIFGKSDNIDYQRDAMSAYLNWPNRSVIPRVEEIIKNTSDKALRSAAERAYVRLSILPAAEPLGESVQKWNSAFQNVGTSSDIQRLVRAVIAYPSQNSLNLLREWAKNETFGSYAQNSIQTLDRTIKNVPTISPGQELKGNQGRVQGDGGAAIDSSVGSLTNWTSPGAWFTWSFRVSEPGDYRVEVSQASTQADSSDFEIFLGGKALRGRSQQTKDLKNFTTVKTEGQVTLGPNQIYTLVLKAGEKVQPRMMDIGGVKLVK